MVRPAPTPAHDDDVAVEEPHVAVEEPAAEAGEPAALRAGVLTGQPTSVPPLPLPPGATGPAPQPRLVRSEEDAVAAPLASATVELRPDELLAGADAAVAATEGDQAGQEERLVLPDPPRPAPDDPAAVTPADAEVDPDPPLQAAATAGTPSLDAADPEANPAPAPAVDDGLVLPDPPRSAGDAGTRPAHPDGLTLPEPPWGPDAVASAMATESEPQEVDAEGATDDTTAEDTPAEVPAEDDAEPAEDDAEPAEDDAEPAEDTPAEDSAEDEAVEGPVAAASGLNDTVDLSGLPDVPSAEPSDRPWTRLYPPGVPETYRYPLVPLSRFLDDAAQDFPDATAATFLGTSTTYRELSDQVDRLAAALVARRLEPGDRIGVVLPWTPQLLVVLGACWRAGLVAVVVDPELVGEALLSQLETARPRALVVHDAAYPVLGGARDRLDSVDHVVTTGLLDALPLLRARMHALRLRLPTVDIPTADGVADLNQLIASTQPIGGQVDLAPETAPAAVVFDRGEPVEVTHYNLVVAAFQARLWIPDVQAGREGVVVAGEVGNAFGLGAGVCGALLSAATLHLPQPGSEGVARTIDDMRPSLLVGTDDALAVVLSPASRRRDLSSVRVTLSDRPASEPAMGPAMQSRTAGRFRTAITAQALGGMVAAQPVYGDARAEIQGLPVTDTEMAVVEADAHGVGLLVARGPQVPGPEGRWVPTGLRGSLDERGQVRVVGPADRVVAHSNGTSDPAVIAAALRRMPTVVDALTRTEYLDDEVILVAEVTVTDDSVSLEWLQESLRKELPNQALPGTWQRTVRPAPEPEPSPEPAPEPDGARSSGDVAPGSDDPGDEPRSSGNVASGSEGDVASGSEGDGADDGDGADEPAAG